MPESTSQSASLDLEAALDEIERSGVSVAAYARERGLPTWRLYNGLRRRRRAGEEVGGAGEPHRTEFVPVRLTTATGPPCPFELVLAGQRTVRVPSSFDENALQRLVRALESC